MFGMHWLFFYEEGDTGNRLIFPSFLLLLDGSMFFLLIAVVSVIGFIERIFGLFEMLFGGLQEW